MFVEEKANGEVKELDNVGKVLLDAASTIEREGLWKVTTSAPGRCVVLAIADASDWDDDGAGRGREAEARVTRHLGLRSGCKYLYEWNDAPERTLEEVVTMLRAVAFSS